MDDATLAVVHGDFVGWNCRGVAVTVLAGNRHLGSELRLRFEGIGRVK